MTRDDILRMVRESTDTPAAALPEQDDDLVAFYFDELERFAALVAAAEREACAKLCDDQVPLDYDAIQTLINCADAIRARGTE